MPRNGSPAGFTLVETLLVVAIFVIIAASVSPRLVAGFYRQRLGGLTSELIDTLRTAQGNSKTALGGGPFGVHLIDGSGGSFILFKGASYAARDAAYDEVHVLPAAFTLTDTVANVDLRFSMVEGATADTGTITLAWPGGGLSQTVSVNAAGSVDLQ
jgi:prepilin-type N-terminal cleavage/methylation domain-containing protein